jgi:hypothetical protein
MSEPGAATSTVDSPMFENGDKPSSRVRLATEMMLSRSYPAGKDWIRSLSELSLPAAATKRIPSWRALSMASSNDSLKPPPPQLLFMMPAPFSRA